MRNRSSFAAGLGALLLCAALCSCGGKTKQAESLKAVGLAEEAAKAVEKAQGAETKKQRPLQKPAGKGKAEEGHKVSGAPAQGETALLKEAERYITLERTESEDGIMVLPKLNEKTLNAEEAAKANALFGAIRDAVQEEIQELHSWEYAEAVGEEGVDLSGREHCSTEYTLRDGILSVLVRRHAVNYAMDYLYAVNFDTASGHFIEPRKLIKQADLGEYEVDRAIQDYAERCISCEWERMVYYGFASEQTLPDGLGDPSYGWTEDLDRMRRNVWNMSEWTEYSENGRPLVNGTKMEHNGLTLVPCVHLEENGQLQICAEIPTMAGAGYWPHMVRISKYPEEAVRLNPESPFGTSLCVTALQVEAACDAARQYFALDKMNRNADGIPFTITPLRMDMMEDLEGHYEPAYVLEITSEATGTMHLAFAAFEPLCWLQNEDDRSWMMIPDSTDIGLVAELESAEGLAVVIENPDAYTRWLAMPLQEVDLTVYGRDMEFAPEGTPLLIFALEDNTELSFDAVAMLDTGSFETQSSFYSVLLNAYESVLVYAVQPEGIPSQAATLKCGAQCGQYLFQTLGMDASGEERVLTVKGGSDDAGS